MNPRTLPPLNAPLFLEAARQHHTPDAGFAADFQELCGFAMDRAIGIEKASLASVASLQSCAIDIYKNSSWASSSCVTPELCKFFEAAAKAIEACIELQLAWLSVFAPDPVSDVRKVENGRATLSADELAYFMDIAIGERFTPAPLSLVASIPGMPAQESQTESALTAWAA